MEFTLRSSTFLLASVICLQLYQAEVGESMHIILRCACPESNKFIPDALANFTIIEKGAHCPSDEIIVTLQKNNKEVCLSPSERQGQHLLNCWQRINKDESKKAACLRRRRPHKK
ncbi:interleukin-8-like [Megalops cyprinoides]|uniref:interleukin-8-like n=1 Tax=Megalops cyprinoides TaxID=118141 RepID=UPI00186509D5|nr:interleukin-8-like [Megalops cyprinoides]